MWEKGFVPSCNLLIFSITLRSGSPQKVNTMRVLSGHLTSNILAHIMSVIRKLQDIFSFIPHEQGHERCVRHANKSLKAILWKCGGSTKLKGCEQNKSSKNTTTKKGYSKNVFFAPLKSLFILYIPETRFHCKYIINHYMYLFLLNAITMHKVTTVTHGHMTVT